MTVYRLEWRQFRGAEAQPPFLHRLKTARRPRDIVRMAEGLGDIAWAREFRISTGNRVVYTDLHALEDWVRSDAELPDPSRHHLWLGDLETDLIADVFLHALTTALEPPIARGVLSVDAGDALLRFVRRSLRRPRI